MPPHKCDKTNELLSPSNVYKFRHGKRMFTTRGQALNNTICAFGIPPSLIRLGRAPLLTSRPVRTRGEPQLYPIHDGNLPVPPHLPK